ncbi:DNA adenine methylase [Oscillochloris sp. ZM17-4]|uniref:DNA adenine methylase n=1 Tax=Oscillochloris sp. ZM17-4 TaxID=2866714 RepID=UPI001C72DD49|nr:DNA adenine methylase [Oscillochloris sp. ZM17-4]
MPARPFLKWAGGKGQLLPELTRLMPPTFARYHEPFVGGGAFFFNLWNSGRLARGGVLSDYNRDLIACYQTVRDHAQELIDALLEHKQRAHDRAYFYDIRDWDRQPGFEQRSQVEKAARMIFLNRTCYNGLYRLNNKGKFNAPFGYYKNPLIVDVDNMHEVSRALQDVELTVGDFADVLDRAEPGDFVYFDPPYAPVSPTASFTHYTGFGFGEDQQRRLADVFRQLAERGCSVMLSNSYTDLTRALYSAESIPGLSAETVRASRKINCDGAKRGFVDELIAWSYQGDGGWGLGVGDQRITVP